MNALYQRAIKDIGKADLSPEDRIKARRQMEMAQRAWLRFRDADCKALSTYNGDGDGSKEASAMCEQRSLLRRIEDLKEYEP